MDYSTLDAKRLAALPAYTLPPIYHLQEQPGNGCYLDPPGYPTYFTRSVYTRAGNSPAKGPNYVITHPDLGTRRLPEWDDDETRGAFFRRLWKPLPLDHPRTQAWLQQLAGHFRYCYEDAERPEYGRPGTLIYPVPSYTLKSPAIDPHWTEDHKAAVLAEAEAFNRQETDRAARIATPDNHGAVVMVRRFYPDFTPPDGFLGGSPTSGRGPGNWWETEAERPTPETCRPRSMGPHPQNTTWCQWCGWVAPEPAAVTV